MTLDDLLAQLERGEVVSLDADSWNQLRDHFEVRADHDTQMNGHLLVLEGQAGWLIAEEPTPETRAVRAMPSRQAVDQFVAARMERYDRMWDGCGCRIDYLAP